MKLPPGQKKVAVVERYVAILEREPGGGGTPRKVGLGCAAHATSQNPYPIYDQNLRLLLPY